MNAAPMVTSPARPACGANHDPLNRWLRSPWQIGRERDAGKSQADKAKRLPVHPNQYLFPERTRGACQNSGVGGICRQVGRHEARAPHDSCEPSITISAMPAYCRILGARSLTGGLRGGCGLAERVLKRSGMVA